MREISEAVKQEIQDLIFDYYAEECEVDRDEITLETNPQEELGSDSLMLVELIELFRYHGISISDVTDLFEKFKQWRDRILDSLHELAMKAIKQDYEEYNSYDNDYNDDIQMM